MRWTLPTLFFPQELLLPALVLAGLMLIVGMRGAAARIVLFVAAFAFAPMLAPVFDALFAALPDWAVTLLLIALAAALLHAALSLVFGKGVADHAVGELLAGFVRFAIRAPFHGVRRVMTFISGRLL